MEKEKVELSKKIDEFLNKYALIRQNFDPIYEDSANRFLGKDASDFYIAARVLEKSGKPEKMFSNWNDICYNTALDPIEGFDLHETLKRKINFFS